MPFKRNYKRRSYRPKKKNYYRKRNYRITRNVNVNKNVHYFVRGSSNNAFAEINGGVGSQQYFSTTFALDQVRNYGEFTSLFDHYKINKVQLKFFLKTDPGASAAASAMYPRLWWCIDHDDNSLENIDSLRERGNSRNAALLPSRPIVINIKPSTLNMLYNGVASTAYAPVYNRWLDATYPSMPHYGLKYAIDDALGQTWKVQIEAKFFLAFKYSR